MPPTWRPRASGPLALHTLPLRIYPDWVARAHRSGTTRAIAQPNSYVPARRICRASAYMLRRQQGAPHRMPQTWRPIASGPLALHTSPLRINPGGVADCSLGWSEERAEPQEKKQDTFMNPEGVAQAHRSGTTRAFAQTNSFAPARRICRVSVYMLRRDHGAPLAPDRGSDLWHAICKKATRHIRQVAFTIQITIISPRAEARYRDRSRPYGRPEDKWGRDETHRTRALRRCNRVRAHYQSRASR